MRGICIWLVLFAASQSPALEAPGKPKEPDLSLLAELFREPAGNYNLGLRISSRQADHPVSVVNMDLRRRIDEGTSRYLIRVVTEGSEQRFCLACTPAGQLEACSGDQGSPPSRTALIPGTSLPWSEVTAGLCTTWRVEPMPDHNTAEVLPSPQRVDRSWHRIRAEFGPDDGRPLRLLRYGDGNEPLSVLEILEIASAGDRRGVRRSLLRLDGVLVLMEVTSGWFEPDEPATEDLPGHD